MDVELVGLALALIVILGGDAIACAIPIEYIKNDLDRLGCSPAVQRMIPIVKFLAVAGLTVGLWVPLVGVAACVGMLAYLAVALWFHFRSNDPLVKFLPAIGFAAFIAAVLFLSYLG